MSENEKVVKTPKDLGWKEVRAYVEPAEKQKERKKSAAEHKSAQRERDAKLGIKPVSVKAKGDDAKALIDRIAKASLADRLEDELSEIAKPFGAEQAPQAAPQQQEVKPGLKGAVIAAFAAGTVFGALVTAVLQ